MKRRIVASALFASLASAVPGAQEETVVPVHEEPRHHLVFDTPGTRILDVQVPPGDTTLYHTHSDPILYVTMSPSQTRSQTLGREWTSGDASQTPGSKPAAPPARARDARVSAGGAPVRLGRMTSTTSYATQPLTHRVNNVGQRMFRLIGITNSSAGDESASPSNGFDTAPEINNRWFRGYRWALTTIPHQHRHANPVAVVLVSGRAIAASTARATLDKPGAFAWFDAKTLHSLRAVGESAEVVEVEVRRPASAAQDRGPGSPR